MFLKIAGEGILNATPGTFISTQLGQPPVQAAIQNLIIGLLVAATKALATKVRARRAARKAGKHENA